MKHPLLLLPFLILAGLADAAKPPIRVIVEGEEEVYHYENPNNGSGPFWCFGSTCIVGSGQSVLVGGVRTIPGAKPPNNARWTLHSHTAESWRHQQKDTTARTREPSPLGILADGTAPGRSGRKRAGAWESDLTSVSRS